MPRAALALTGPRTGHRLPAAFLTSRQHDPGETAGLIPGQTGEAHRPGGPSSRRGVDSGKTDRATFGGAAAGERTGKE